MLQFIRNAKANNVDLVVFPEMSLGGYLVGDKWNDENFCNNLMSYNEQLRIASDGIAIAYGNVCVDNNVYSNGSNKLSAKFWHPNKDGRTRKYNAVYVYQNQKPAEELKILIFFQMV